MYKQQLEEYREEIINNSRLLREGLNKDRNQSKEPGNHKIEGDVYKRQRPHCPNK